MAKRFSPKLFIGFVSFIRELFKVLNSAKDISLDTFMIFGPSANYVFQAIKFYRTKSSKGFSNYLCLVTILAHTTKIFFWFGERYKYTLLMQSVLVIIILLYIIYLCLKYNEKKGERRETYTSLLDISMKKKIKKCFWEIFSFSKTFDPKLIWRWDNVIEYYKFYFLIVAVLTLLLFICGIENIYYANALGYINLVLELLCSLPQIIELHKTKDQRNISKLMVILWFTGNVLKIYYNYINNSPLQLILGAYIQVFFNNILIGQLIYYYIQNKNENTIFENNTNEKNEKKGINSHEINDNKEHEKIFIFEDQFDCAKEDKPMNVDDDNINDIH